MLIDTRGLTCPWPVLRVAKALREHGRCTATVITNDPIAPHELAAFASEHGMDMSETTTALGPGFTLTPKR